LCKNSEFRVKKIKAKNEVNFQHIFVTEKIM